MDAFQINEQVVKSYEAYVRSFLTVCDPLLRCFIEEEVFVKRRLWPDPLIQLNPAYAAGPSVDALCSQGALHPGLAEIFRDSEGKPFRLYHHQHDTIRLALARRSYVVTSGTGSGKSLTYFIPIMDEVLRSGRAEPGVRAIIVYPMNVLCNSQLEALQNLRKRYEERTGREFPVTFGRYTGQDTRDEKRDIQRKLPHILLTNYVMLELMLVRPEETRFLSRSVSHLVLDELHTYRKDKETRQFGEYRTRRLVLEAWKRVQRCE